jgi:hypothetical protein
VRRDSLRAAATRAERTDVSSGAGVRGTALLGE